MRVRRYRCFSGPADNRSFTPFTPEQAQKLFIWFALGRTFAQEGYPMWADAFELWPPQAEPVPYSELVRMSYAIGFADNECVSLTFPANNPVKGAPEVIVRNPMTPLEPTSYWSTVMAPAFAKPGIDRASRLVTCVRGVFAEWERLIRKGNELHLENTPQYLIGVQPLTRGAGLLQIRDYSREAVGEVALRDAIASMAEEARLARQELAATLRTKPMSYFAQGDARPLAIEFKPKTKFEKVLERRLTLAAYLLAHGRTDANLGRTKLAKLIYLSDAVNDGLGMEMQYETQAAGPLDARAFYNESVGLEPLAKKTGCFTSSDAAKGVTRYTPGPTFEAMATRASELFSKEQLARVQHVLSVVAPLDTEQAEIVATLYACWDARLKKKQPVTDEELLLDVHAWHEKKRRFQKDRLVRAMKWMKKQQLVPTGNAPAVRIKRTNGKP